MSKRVAVLSRVLLAFSITSLAEASLPRALADWPAAVSRPRWSPTGDRIAFASDREGTWDLYVIDVASGESERLMATADRDDRPSWSPDGTHLVFQSDRGGGLHLWILSMDDGAVRPLTSGEWIESAPHWSPRGDLITYVTQAGGSWDVWVIQPTGDGARQVTTHPGSEYHPKFSPDGERITFYPTWDGWTDIAVADLGTGTVTNILGSEHEDYRPDWSPDGKRIVFASDRGDEGGLWTVPAEGGEPTRLVGGPDGFDYPDWSPDGESILYTALTVNALLFEANIDGSGVRALTRGEAPAQDLDPDVSRDGTVVYQNNRHGNEDNVVVLDRTSGQERRVSKGRQNDGDARFSPSGKRIAHVRSGGDQTHADLFVVETAGGEPVRWTERGNVAFPAFCGEETIVFLWDEVAYTGVMELWMKREGGEPARIGDVVLRRDGIDCSRDGETVVATLAVPSDASSGSPLVKIATRTGKVERLTHGPADDLNPRISPDGNTVAFVSQRDAGKPPAIYTVPFGGGEPRLAIATDRRVTALAWDGPERLVFSAETRRQAAREFRLK